MKNKMEQPPNLIRVRRLNRLLSGGGSYRILAGREAGGGLNVRKSAEKLVTKDGSLCVVRARDLKATEDAPADLECCGRRISSFPWPCAFSAVSLDYLQLD